MKPSISSQIKIGIFISTLKEGGRGMDPVNTRPYLDVDSTFFERNGRHMDAKTMLCAYWGSRVLL